MDSLGKQIRFNRIINQESGKVFFVTMDHAINRGVMPGIANVRQTIGKLAAGGPDCLVMHKGLAREYFRPYAGKLALAIKVSAFSPYQPTYDTVVTDVEEAVSIGADAVSIGVIVGGRQQSEMLSELGRVSKAATLAGVPLIAHMYPAGELIDKDRQHDWQNIAYAARTGVELGVDIVKTWYTGDPESFRKVVEATHGRVVAAGGAKADSPRQVLELTRDVMSAGALGVAYGRNIFEYKDPANMIKALKLMIHGSGDVDEALRILG